MSQRVKTYSNILSLAVFMFLLASSCVVSVPVGDSSGDVVHEVIVQTNPNYLDALQKDYRHINWTVVKRLSYQVGTYLVTISVGNQSPELVLSTLQRDVRITQAEWNKPYLRRE